jgi:hypothetical protein
VHHAGPWRKAQGSRKGPVLVRKAGRCKMRPAQAAAPGPSR